MRYKMLKRNYYHLIIIFSFILLYCGENKSNKQSAISISESKNNTSHKSFNKINNQIRKEKFNLIVPNAMRKNNIDM